MFYQVLKMNFNHILKMNSSQILKMNFNQDLETEPKVETETSHLSEPETEHLVVLQILKSPKESNQFIFPGWSTNKSEEAKCCLSKYF